MIIEVNEINYKGFDIHHIEKGGWEVILHDVKILFPTLQDAQSVIDEFYRETVKKYKGKKIIP